ncbi:uncharacterized protein LOC143265223 [Megachile rotundata]|uniref:uncharacterized protein LOC143265223 n=1 Tax=Megachile rotundata TaxID=143995 RepID=UPI003FD5E3CF
MQIIISQPMYTVIVTFKTLLAYDNLDNDLSTESTFKLQNSTSVTQLCEYQCLRKSNEVLVPLSEILKRIGRMTLAEKSFRTESSMNNSRVNKEESCRLGNRGAPRSNLCSVSDDRIIYCRIKIFAFREWLYFEGSPFCP